MEIKPETVKKVAYPVAAAIAAATVLASCQQQQQQHFVGGQVPPTVQHLKK